MKQFLKVGLLMIFGHVLLLAQSPGTTSFRFLKQQYSARGAAMAGNLVAVSNDLNALPYNPAAIATLKKPQWVINYVDHLLDFQGGQLAYARPLKHWGNLGIQLIYFNYGEFKETDIWGDFTGRTFTASEFALGATLSNFLAPHYQYGVSVKLVYSALDRYTASAIAFDAGIIYQSPAIADLSIGISLSNTGFVLKRYGRERLHMPLHLRVGMAKRLAHLPLLFTAALNDLTTSDGGPLWNRLKQFSVGGEFEITPSIHFRLGYRNDVNQSVKPLSGRNFAGISAGLGIAWKKFRFDYAYVTYGQLGVQNRIGIVGEF